MAKTAKRHWIEDMPVYFYIGSLDRPVTKEEARDHVQARLNKLDGIVNLSNLETARQNIKI